MRSFIATLAAAIVQGKRQALDTFKLTLDGVETTKYVVSDGCTGADKSFTCPPGNKGYLVNDPWLDIDEPNMFKPNLLGATVEYDIDLSKADCGCLDKLSLAAMPATIGDSGYDRSDRLYYCDANIEKKGAHCSEVNLMKANKYALETVMRNCYKQYHGEGMDQTVEVKCSHADSMASSEWFQDKKAYGPGSEYTIDTRKPVHIRHEFGEEEGKFFSMKTIVAQDGLARSMTNYMSHVAEDLTSEMKYDMTFVFERTSQDNWDPTKDLCSATCNSQDN